ncbi:MULTISPECIES: Nramp family divalent metal transporter [unclassified Arsukibacterium]|uniref:Nramp family divalent metal transporter n=1 Tax=unclassified Arsukibacterium TaxID=2635278 RepID=UPI000C58B16D|nr:MULTISPECIES: Nramp family divalent metal transporter [unclassified Arsukibacterium]MAB17884.1 manganese transporter [Roseobacter sp.]MBM33374.1 manganese transporter [Rheinheimera sp.]HAW92523.1 manganese transporter [Candidatus Azambacteria bacterium]|tara:strand:- start:9524 stop:10768 length:1245 start_codon:yes stop_codon:yes gene_type:complete
MKTKTPLFTLGPATLVTAAFIGPGTVISASLAGANYGYALLWALLFSVIATLILQEMAARLGIVTGQGLGENLRVVFKQPWLKYPMMLLTIAAVVIGNSAYQGGNISGASMGADALWQHSWLITSLRELGLANPWALLIGAVAITVLWQRNYLLIERCLIALVLLMSLAFLTTLFLSKPDMPALLRGLFLPSLPAGAVLSVIALVGTTVVPYSLFLHAAASARKSQGSALDKKQQLALSNADIRTAIPLGGLISIAILSTAAAAFFGRAHQIDNAVDLAHSLQPLAGDAAVWLMAGGLLGAGVSSAITAPLAAAYALNGLIPLSNGQFRACWLLIVLIGIGLSSMGIKPLAVIWFAQVANGILLPLISLALLLAVNSSIMGQYKNTIKQNIIAVMVWLLTLLLSGRSLYLAIFA